MTSVEKRLADERKVITVLIRVAKAHGYKLTRVWDGEENQYPQVREGRPGRRLQRGRVHDTVQAP